MLLLIGILFPTLLILWYLNDGLRCRGYPPGPFRFPIVGNLPQLICYQLNSKNKTPSYTMRKLAEVHGDVLTVRMGLVDFVVFSSFDAISELVGMDTVRNRKTFEYYDERNDYGNVGILTSNGPTWHNLRRFTIRTLREFGFGKSSTMDSVVREEALAFVKELKRKLSFEKHVPTIHMQADLFDLTVVKVLWRLVTGNEIEDEGQIRKLTQIGHEYVQSLRVDDIGVCYPGIRSLFPSLLGVRRQKQCSNLLKEFIVEVVQEFKEKRRKNESGSSFIDVFLGRIEEERERNATNETIFTETQLIYTLLDLFQAGSETTSKTLAFVILHMVRNPEIQNRVLAEIDTECSDGDGTWVEISELKTRMPFTQAILLETMRVNSVVPVPGPYVSFTDLRFRGYKIPKGTPLMCNLEAVHYDKKVWGEDVLKFRPERFLKETEGRPGTEIDAKLAEHVLPFGKGKRVCPGQGLAEATLFRCFVVLFKWFQFEKEEGAEVPSDVPIPGLTYEPLGFDVRVRLR